MIEIPRSLARQLRAIFRRCVLKSTCPPRPQVVFQTGQEGFRIQVYLGETAAEYYHAGSCSSEVLIVPVDALAAFEGRGDDPVSLEVNGAGRVFARWQDGGVPQAVEYEAGNPDTLPKFPETPGKFTSNQPGFINALADARQTAEPEAHRYAVHRIQLRGRTGEVVATDGRQLLLQAGFRFPWSENLLVPCPTAFGCRELPQDLPVEIGRTENHVTVRVGPWTLHLQIDKEGRFPPAEHVIPATIKGSTQWRIAKEDAAFLARAIQRLPGNGEENQPVTVDLGQEAVIRARGPEQTRMTELVLARSQVSGKPVRFAINRKFLARIVQLGFLEVHVPSPNAPLLCQDEQRKYVVMLLGQEVSIPPDKDAQRVVSGEASTSIHSTPPERRNLPVPVPTNNGSPPEPIRPPDSPDQSGGINDLIAETEELRTILSDASTKAARLVGALKHQRRQSRAVRQAMQSLRQLQLDR